VNPYNQKRHQEAVEKWSSIIRSYENDCQTEQIPVKDWCYANGIGNTSFSQWQHYFQQAKDGCEPVSLRNASPKHPKKADSSAPVLVDITSLAAGGTPEIVCSTASPENRQTSGTPSIMIQVNGVQIYVNDGVREDTLAAVLKAVRHD
jgi:hypothetical protein